MQEEESRTQPKPEARARARAGPRAGVRTKTVHEADVRARVAEEHAEIFHREKEVEQRVVERRVEEHKTHHNVCDQHVRKLNGGRGRLL